VVVIMKKTMALILACLMLVSLFTGCTKATPVQSPEANSSSDPSTEETKFSGTLKLWSFTDEVKTLALAFEEKYPDVKVEYTMIPMTSGEFQTKLKSALQTGEVPDVVSLEAAFVREYIESDFLADVSDLLPLAKELGTYQFTIDIAR
jgi:ABC-type glycerol-3-phosphate transport system substrate-binding protein